MSAKTLQEHSACVVSWVQGSLVHLRIPPGVIVLSADCSTAYHWHCHCRPGPRLSIESAFGLVMKCMYMLTVAGTVCLVAVQPD